MYQFAPEARKALEAMPLPIAYYQRVGDGIVAILVSDGLCMMMGADRDDLIPSCYPHFRMIIPKSQT